MQWSDVARRNLQRGKTDILAGMHDSDSNDTVAFRDNAF
jgi:hypothetical protein